VQSFNKKISPGKIFNSKDGGIFIEGKNYCKPGNFMSLQHTAPAHMHEIFQLIDFNQCEGV